MLKAYLDGSGNDAEHPCVLVAGYVAPAAIWEIFEERWGAFLTRHDLPRFHATTYAARRRPYSRWSDADYEAVPDEIFQIFDGLNLLGDCCALSLSAFHEWRERQDHWVQADPYYFCLDHVLKLLVRGVAETPEDEGVVIYCDREDNHEKLGLELAHWHEQKLRRDDDVGASVSRKRSVDTHYGSSFDHWGLQAADVFAHSMFQRVRDHMDGAPWDQKSPILDALERARATGGIFLDSPEMIEAIRRSRYRAPRGTWRP